MDNRWKYMKKKKTPMQQNVVVKFIFLYITLARREGAKVETSNWLVIY
jgi:hypothetical protein